MFCCWSNSLRLAIHLLTMRLHKVYMHVFQALLVVLEPLVALAGSALDGLRVGGSARSGAPTDRGVLLLSALSSHCALLQSAQPSHVELCMGLADALAGAWQVTIL